MARIVSGDMLEYLITIRSAIKAGFARGPQKAVRTRIHPIKTPAQQMQTAPLKDLGPIAMIVLYQAQLEISAVGVPLVQHMRARRSQSVSSKDCENIAISHWNRPSHFQRA